jgi:hypothetical protein
MKGGKQSIHDSSWDDYPLSFTGEWGCILHYEESIACDFCDLEIPLHVFDFHSLLGGSRALRQVGMSAPEIFALLLGCYTRGAFSERHFYFSLFNIFDMDFLYYAVL